jgi:hypothetical protein
LHRLTRLSQSRGWATSPSPTIEVVPQARLELAHPKVLASETSAAAITPPGDVWRTVWVSNPSRRLERPPAPGTYLEIDRRLELRIHASRAGRVSHFASSIVLVDLRGLEPRWQSPCKGNPGAPPEAHVGRSRGSRTHNHSVKSRELWPLS